MEYRDDRRYTAEGIWALVAGDGSAGSEATIGISDFAQEAMGELVYVDLPALGTSMRKGAPFGPVESVKAAVEPEAPLSGEVVARNEAVEADPELINQSPYEDGWWFRLRISDPTEFDALLSADDYCGLVEPVD
jgi:glycine cleavage system H protein